jgi:hypothetical protein
LALWATAIRLRAETARKLLHSTGRGFLSRLVAWVPFSRFGWRANAIRGTGESCLPTARLSPSLEEGPNQPAWFDLSPVARDYPEQIGFNFHFDQPVVLSMN